MISSDTPPANASRHEVLYRTLRKALEGNLYKIGEMMPTETCLCTEHQVSRYAVREALKRLEDEGFIRRRRGSGTRVISNKRKNPVFRHAIGSRSELELFARGTRIEFDEGTLLETDGKLARLLGCDELRRWYCFRGIRYDHDTPFGITTMYLDANRVGQPGAEDFGHEPVYRWMERHAGLRLSGVSQDVTAVALTKDQADLFGEAAGTPALQIIRRYFDEQNMVFEIAVTVHRTNFVHNMRIRHDP